MTPIQTNKPLFFADDGEALEGGQIYVGQPSTDPRTNPKTVTFRDSGGAEFTAKQPMETLAGRIVYNGKPIVALVDGEYSLLILDSAGKQLDYSRSVTPSGSSGDAIADFSEVMRVGLTLNEIQSFDVSAGESVRNVGKITATDDLGADWLVVSATGSPADDVDLIDFTNGLQGERQNSKVYRKDVIQSGHFMLDDPANIISLTNANSYRNTWTSVNISSAVPDEAIAANVRVLLRATYPSNTISNNISAFIYARKTGSTTGISDSDGTRLASGQENTNTNALIGVNLTAETVIPLEFGATSTFDIYLVVNDPTSTANNVDPDLAISVTGYTINAKDLI